MSEARRMRGKEDLAASSPTGWWGQRKKMVVRPVCSCHHVLSTAQASAVSLMDRWRHWDSERKTEIDPSYAASEWNCQGLGLGMGQVSGRCVLLWSMSSPFHPAQPTSCSPILCKVHREGAASSSAGGGGEGHTNLIIRSCITHPEDTQPGAFMCPSANDKCFSFNKCF